MSAQMERDPFRWPAFVCWTAEQARWQLWLALVVAIILCFVR